MASRLEVRLNGEPIDPRAFSMESRLEQTTVEINGIDAMRFHPGELVTVDLIVTAPIRGIHDRITRAARRLFRRVHPPARHAMVVVEVTSNGRLTLIDQMAWVARNTIGWS